MVRTKHPEVWIARFKEHVKLGHVESVRECLKMNDVPYNIEEALMEVKDNELLTEILTNEQRHRRVECPQFEILLDLMQEGREDVVRMLLKPVHRVTTQPLHDQIILELTQGKDDPVPFCDLLRLLHHNAPMP
jgi:hypothetical protein